MNWFKKIFTLFGRNPEEPEYDLEAEWDESDEEKPSDFHNKEQRMSYVRGCLEKIAEASRELENLNFEYNMVTSYLKDMEEIEALPEDEAEELKACAKRVELLQDSKDAYMGRARKISEEQFQRMERVIDGVDESIAKLREAEAYQEVIRKDLSRLDGERNAYAYRKSEVMGVIEDTRGMAVICSAAFGLCILLLLGLQFMLEMDTQIGYLLTAGVAAASLTVIFLKHMDAKRELTRVELSTNKLILLQNKVKIRYINNTSLLEYLQLKYQVSNAEELEKLVRNYREEKEEREKFKRAELDLDYSEQELLNMLKHYRISDPAIWLHQTEAILEHKEMVEIRHNLIIRRQSLRRRMDYNKEVVAGAAQRDIKDLVHRYPEYMQEIIQMVEKYEKNM